MNLFSFLCAEIGKELFDHKELLLGIWVFCRKACENLTDLEVEKFNITEKLAQ